ncbi:MAG: class I SAM-dependent methyltransferase [Betaproteobacteria bacterium]|nr:class I SAM-dependent methyltransferase [Betaproteobacteria bacterium]
MFFEAQLRRLAENLRAAASIPLRIKLWNGHLIDLAPEPAVTVRVTRPSAAIYLLMPNLAWLGKAFVEGHLEVEGPIREVIRIGEALSRHRPAQFPLSRFLRRPGRHSRRSDAGAIEYHYDVSDDFYRLWLDRNMVYSCAYFRAGGEDLDTAQEQKLDYICRKLMLRPGERLLDIGCGWGGLICWAARHYGVDATGVTLSRSQHQYAAARIESEGLGQRCRVLLQDYRDIPGDESFDKIASVGMFEHVGLKNLPVYFGAIHRLLRKGGLVLNHGITAMDPDSREVGLGAGEFIDRYVFPHGELPHLSLAIRQMACRDLEVTDVESLRPHYSRTLMHWFTRLESHADRAKDLVGDRRYRVWLVYLAGCAYAFEQGWVSVHQVLAAKTGGTGMETLRWTREYMYDEPQPAADRTRSLPAAMGAAGTRIR